jgi:D-alanyl-D-alanine carboxypeptidase
VLAALALPAAAHAAATTAADVQRGLDRLVASSGGPPGAIATLYRNGRTTVVRAGRLGLDDTIAQRLPDMPPAWGGVTVRQMLNHTSGVPEYTESEAFVEHVKSNPGAHVSPIQIIDWVRSDPLVFTPGTSYAYSNTDNIVVGLIAEAVTGESYETLLQEFVFGPAELRQTSFPSTLALPRPFIRGYLGRRFFDAARQAEQLRFVRGGKSSPPGPGKNSAGLAVFRYQTRCGTVYGHSGNLRGYAQFAAASADGTRAVTTTLNIPAPTGRLLKRLRAVQETAVCAVLK